MSEVSTYSWSDMRGAVEALERAVQAAMNADKAEADSFLTDVKQFLKHGFDADAKREFQIRADRLLAQADAAMASILRKRDGELQKNAPIPGQLQSDASTWEKAAFDLAQRRVACQGLQVVPGWSGEAQQRYGRAVGVQKEALQELEGVMLSTAQSCYAGATLNRAIFLAVATGATQAQVRVERQKHGRSGDMYYLRTANAIPVLEALDALIERAIAGDVVTGSVSILSGEHGNTVKMPNLLPEGGWPSGTDAAGVEAAATETGVVSDGEDAQTRLNAVLNSCMAGANL